MTTSIKDVCSVKTSPPRNYRECRGVSGPSGRKSEGHTAVYIEGSREARHSSALLPFSDMKTLVVLAVMVATTAHQAYGIPVPGILSHGTHAYGYGQAPYVGPLASSVPAGIGGKVIPVSDTYEVAAARDQFFRAYQDQLNTIYAIRANRPAYHNTYGYGHGHHAPVVHTSHAVHAPVVHTSHAVRTPVVHTSHAVHAPVVHTSHAVHASPAVHHNYIKGLLSAMGLHKYNPDERRLFIDSSKRSFKRRRSERRGQDDEASILLHDHINQGRASVKTSPPRNYRECRGVSGPSGRKSEGHTAVYIEGSREARHSSALLPFSDMKTLVVLAVMVATTAHQAYGIPVPGIPSHGTHAYGYGQAPYVGPLASSVPAGIGGKVIPVSDTYEVAAARDQFFRAYQDQLNTIYAIRANRPAYHNTYGYEHGHHAPVVHTSHAVHAPVVHTSHAVRTPVVHTSHAVHAPVVHTSHAVHASPAVHHNWWRCVSAIPQVFSREALLTTRFGGPEPVSWQPCLASLSPDQPLDEPPYYSGLLVVLQPPLPCFNPGHRWIPLYFLHPYYLLHSSSSPWDPVPVCCKGRPCVKWMGVVLALEQLPLCGVFSSDVFYQDELTSYFTRFERIAALLNIPQDNYAIRLGGLLSDIRTCRPWTTLSNVQIFGQLPIMLTRNTPQLDTRSRPTSPTKLLADLLHRPGGLPHPDPTTLLYFSSGTINGARVSTIIRDTGCSCVIVSEEVLPDVDVSEEALPDVDVSQCPVRAPIKFSFKFCSVLVGNVEGVSTPDENVKKQPRTSAERRWSSLQCRRLVLSLTHESPMSGHLSHKTRGLTGVSFYFDNIFIYGTTWTEHIAALKSVLWHLREHGLTARVSECRFGFGSIQYLGFIVDEVFSREALLTARFGGPEPVSWQPCLASLSPDQPLEGGSASTPLLQSWSPLDTALPTLHSSSSPWDPVPVCCQGRPCVKWMGVVSALEQLPLKLRHPEITRVSRRLRAEKRKSEGHTAVYIEGSREARHSSALLPFSDMKTLVVLAVMVATTAHQAYGIPVPGIPSHGTHAYGYGQAPYVGPLASSVPAGIGGKVIPVSDTYEVAAARDQFFRAYQDQLNTIYAIRASRPAYHDSHGHGHHGSAGAVHVSHGTHSSYGTPAVHAPVVHAPAVHTSHIVHSAPAVHTSHTVHSSPAVHTSHAVHSGKAVHTSHAVHAPVVHAAHAVHAPAVHTSHAVHAAPVVHHKY
ncbi:uncharacterized protein LOC123498472 [Portunus trituberculatus]|uniref:uncharacterized protein LOC123498472 n=1 Tax=Portunus trituberculatus TaxID=210409 RepID=UPI001E1CC5C7|nr:uncharacterized protein LOC123498472 [Portunus trituberculatus]